jgi:hypothetical protein
MDNLERRAVECVARLGPWLAPAPSAFFVARSAIAHLAVPWPVAAAIAAVIETLGLTTVTTALRLYEWNRASLTAAGNLRRGRTLAPPSLILLSIATAAIYLIITIGLTVVLEVKPDLATAAPAIFPLLAIVGAVNLAVRSDQARREMDAWAAKSGRSGDRSGGQKSDRTGGRGATAGRTQTGQVTGHIVQSPPAADRPGVPNLPAPAQIDRANRARQVSRVQALADLLDYFDRNPTASHRQAGRAIGRSKSWVTGVLGELELAGRISRNGGGVEVINEQEI